MELRSLHALLMKLTCCCLTIFATAAAAVNKSDVCNKLLSSNPTAPSFSVVGNDKWTEDVHLALQNLNDLLGPRLRVQSNTTITLVSDLPEGYGSIKYYWNEIELGLSEWEDFNENPSSVLAHEFGHLALRQYVNAHDPTFLDLKGFDRVSYDELFADIVAVLFKNDPRAMNKNEEQGLVEEQEFVAQVSLRDFTIPMNVYTWVRADEPADDKYRLFDPIRYLLWHSILKNLSFEQKAIFLEIYLETMVSHLKQRAARNPNFHLDPASDVNLEFFGLLLLKAKETGLQIAPL